MRQSFAFRVFAVLFAPWFAISTAEPAALHDCPIHSVHAAAHAVAAHSMAGHAMAEGAMDHATAQEHQGAPHEASHHQCCCPDSSCASAVAALIFTAPRLAWVPAEIQRDESPTVAASFVPASAEHVLPFANGPPAARI